MQDVVEQLSKPAFWICSVIIGVLINFVSQYLYPRLGVVPGRLGAWVRRYSARRREAFQREVAKLDRNRVLIPFYIADEMRQRSALVLALVIMVMALALIIALKFSAVILGPRPALEPAAYILTRGLWLCGYIAPIVFIYVKNSADRKRDVLAAVRALDESRIE